MANNERLEREIEEILGKIEQFPDKGARAKRARERKPSRLSTAVSGWQQGIAQQLSRVSVSQVMLASFLMILFSFFFRGRFLPAPVASWILIAGVILFVSTFAVMMFGKGRSRTVEQRWRGRTIEYRSGPTLSGRLRRWWTSRSRR